MVGRMLRAAGKVQKERLVGCELFTVADKADGPVYHVWRQVIAFFRRLWWLNLMGVVDEIRVILAGVAAEKSIEAFKAAPQRPTVIGTS